MSKLFGWGVGIALFCWATVSAFSIFSELKFLVDGWTWSVDQVPISIKAIALMIGKYVSGVVGGYREFVHGLVQMLRLPQLPQFVYDTAGVVTFSIARGRWLGERSHRKLDEWLAKPRPQLVLSPNPISTPKRGANALHRHLHATAAANKSRARRRHDQKQQEETSRYYRERPLLTASLRVRDFLTVRLSAAPAGLAAQCLVYGGAVAVALTTLFGIDFLYRHFV